MRHLSPREVCECAIGGAVFGGILTALMALLLV